MKTEMFTRMSRLGMFLQRSVRWKTSSNASSSTIPQFLPFFKLANIHKNKRCVRDKRGEYSCLGLARCGRRLAAQIVERLGGSGFRQEPLALLTSNSAFALLGLSAVWMSGHIAVPLDSDWREETLGYILSDCRPRLALVTADLVERLTRLAPRLQLIIIPTQLMDEARYQETRPASETEEKLENEEEFGLSAEFYTQNDALIVYTAGTTGPPRGAVLSFVNLSSQARSVTEPWSLRSSDVCLSLRPLSTSDGIACGLIAPLSLGASVILGENLSTEEVWAEILGVQGGKGERMNLLFADSRVYRNLVDEYERAKQRRKWTEKMEEYIKGICIQKIRLMLSTSLPVPKTVLEKWESYTGQELLEVYSLAEASIIASPRPSSSNFTSTVGLPIPGIKMKIMSDDGDLIAQGDSSGTKVISIWENRPVAGSLWIKGDMVARKYWGDKKEKTSWTPDGWFKTGDIVSYSKGQYNILGRQKCDIVKTKSHKISLLQIEAAMLDMPEIQDVAAFSIIQNGVTIIGAAVCRRGGSTVDLEKVRSFLRSRFPEYAIPTLIIDVPTVPRNHRGMISRHEIQTFCSTEYQKIILARKKSQRDQIIR